MCLRKIELRRALEYLEHAIGTEGVALQLGEIATTVTENRPGTNQGTHRVELIFDVNSLFTNVCVHGDVPVYIEHWERPAFPDESLPTVAGGLPSQAFALCTTVFRECAYC